MIYSTPEKAFEGYKESFELLKKRDEFVKFFEEIYTRPFESVLAGLNVKIKDNTHKIDMVCPYLSFDNKVRFIKLVLNILQTENLPLWILEEFKNYQHRHGIDSKIDIIYFGKDSWGDSSEDENKKCYGRNSFEYDKGYVDYVYNVINHIKKWTLGHKMSINSFVFNIYCNDIFYAEHSANSCITEDGFELKKIFMSISGDVLTDFNYLYHKTQYKAESIKWYDASLGVMKDATVCEILIMRKLHKNKDIEIFCMTEKGKNVFSYAKSVLIKKGSLHYNFVKELLF